MDSEQILLNIYKQQHYDATQYKMQKFIVSLGAIASFAGVVLMMIFYTGMLYVYTFAGAVIWAGVAMLLARLKVVSLNIASLTFMLYACFVLIPVFWHLTGIMGGAPHVSLILLVGILSMFSGKTLKLMLFFYLMLLSALTIFSIVVEIPVAADIPKLGYTIAAYIIAVMLISFYLLLRIKEFDKMNDVFLRSSFKDELTRLFNRKVLDLIMQYEESLYKQEKSDYILVMLDIDNFKQINDEHGHVFGDVILRNIAKLINDKVRSSDFVVRYGGDEFLVVQTNATNNSISLFTDSIEEAIASFCETDMNVSTSYGFAARSECKTPEEVLVLADKRLYEKKKAFAKEEF